MAISYEIKRNDWNTDGGHVHPVLEVLLSPQRIGFFGDAELVMNIKAPKANMPIMPQGRPKTGSVLYWAFSSTSSQENTVALRTDVTTLADFV